MSTDDYRADDQTCFICICLLAVTVVLEFVTMSPYEVSQIACTMSMEMRLHEERPDLPQAEQDERRRLFWSLFLVDRVSAYPFTDLSNLSLELD